MSDNGSLKEIIVRGWTALRIAISKMGLGIWFWTRKVLRLSKEDKMSDFGSLKWPVRHFVLAHPRERTGALKRAKPAAEELVGLESQGGVIRTDPSRV
jgi:hypothetical protein